MKSWQYLSLFFLVASIGDECGTTNWEEAPKRERDWPSVPCNDPNNGIGPGGFCDKSDPQKHKCICKPGWKESTDRKTCFRPSKSL